MIRNYFKIAWRNLLKNKFYAALSIIGLTIGLTVGILILIWIQDELSYNKSISESDSIYRVNSSLGSDGKFQTWNSSPGPVAIFAKNEIPEVKNAARIMRNWNFTVFNHKDAQFESRKAVYVDPNFFTMFNTEFLNGNVVNPFPDRNSVVITASTAAKIFGKQNPLGKTITAEQEHDFTVTGVIQDLPSNSSVNYDLFIPLSLFEYNNYDGTGYWKSMDSDWGNFNYTTYLKLSSKNTVNKVTQDLTRINRANDPNAKKNKAKDVFSLQEISTLNLYQANGEPAKIQIVKIFSIVALLILIIASINYINLTTARSMRRAKEVSIRKIVGGGKKQLFFQFMIESVLFFVIALVLSCLLTYLLMPYFNTLSGKSIQFSLWNVQIWRIILYTFLGTLAAASIYPALLLSSFKPLEAIKGRLTNGMASANFRKVLVTVQFVFSVALIIGTLVIGEQLNFIQSKDPGYNHEQVLTFSGMRNMHDHLDAVKAQLTKNPAIQDIALSRSPFLGSGNTTGDNEWDGKDKNNMFIVQQFGMDENFIPLMKMKFVEGHNFKGIPLDSTHYILNETAIREMGIKNPIGKRFSLHENEGTIIGVVKDFNHNSLRQKVEPSVIYYEPEGYFMYLKTTGKAAQKAITTLNSVWEQYNPGFPFNYSFLDQDYDRMYRSEQRTGKLFKIFSGIAIFVSCLGLFGLASFTAQLKRKEIGIRKVLGASAFRISYLLSVNFLKLVLFATLIAIPIAWYSMQIWLQGFAYRINISWWIFVASTSLVMLVAIITVSFQAIKAAVANPVKSLRSE